MSRSLEKCIQDELNLRCLNLVEWFRNRPTELPRIAGIYMSLFNMRSADYATRSGLYNFYEYLNFMI